VVISKWVSDVNNIDIARAAALTTESLSELDMLAEIAKRAGVPPGDKAMLAALLMSWLGAGVIRRDGDWYCRVDNVKAVIKEAQQRARQNAKTPPTRGGGINADPPGMRCTLRANGSKLWTADSTAPIGDTTLTAVRDRELRAQREFVRGVVVEVLKEYGVIPQE